MTQFNHTTYNYVINSIELASKNMPKTTDNLIKDHKTKDGVFNFLPLNLLEIAEMLKVYHAYKFTNPTWVTQYEVRTKYNKSAELIKTMVKDGRLRAKQDGDKTLYAKDDLDHLQKFDLLFALLESKELTRKLDYPALKIDCYGKWNIKEKGKDLSLGQIQVMDILVNEFTEIRMADPKFRREYREYLDNYENKITN